MPRMFGILILLLPVAEIYVLIQVGRAIGAVPTVFLVVFTGVLGALLLRVQGLSTLGRVQASLARGEAPALEMLEGMIVAVGGGLLLIPGFITDAVGILALIPPVRRFVIRRFLARQGTGPSGRTPDAPQGPSGPRVIEGEYRREDEDRRPPRGP
ncbi:MAG: hypothetical protein B7Z66_13660 [Chromatiales bacterium 21-64-14]|nr:MAG: hypothetical protein B7Z66_13660 [Chromatiales bacterium 21-64-14]